MWLVGVVVRRYIDFLILLIPTPLVCSFLQQHPTFCSFLNCFSFLFQYFSCIKHYVQPSYGCCGTPVVPSMFVYTEGKIFNA